MSKARIISLIVGIIVAAVIILAIKPNFLHHSGEDKYVPTAEEIEIYKSDQAEESLRLADSHNIATRTKDSLIVFHESKPIARFKDINPYERLKGKACDVWSFGSRQMLQDSPNAPLKPYALLTYSPSEGGKIAIVDHDGSLFWFDYQLMAGSRYIASGSIWDMHTAPHFILVDWASPGHATAYRSDHPCEPIKWLSTSKLLANCENRTNTETFIAGEFSLGNDGNWRFVQTGFIDGENVVQAVTGGDYRINRTIKGAPLTFTLSRFVYKNSPSTIWSTDPNGRSPQGYERLVH